MSRRLAPVTGVGRAIAIADVATVETAARARRTAQHPRDTAALIAFLLSADGGWINGQLLKSDGGFGAKSRVGRAAHR